MSFNILLFPPRRSRVTLLVVYIYKFEILSVCMSVSLSECLLLHHAKTTEPNGLKFSGVISATFKKVIGSTRGL